jgi:hypothetical protein
MQYAVIHMLMSTDQCQYGQIKFMLTQANTLTSIRKISFQNQDWTFFQMVNSFYHFSSSPC